MDAQFDADEERLIQRLVQDMTTTPTTFMFIPRGYNKAKILNEARRRAIEQTLNEPRS